MKLESLDSMGMKRLSIDGELVGHFNRAELIQLRDFIDALIPTCWDPDPDFVVPGRIPHYG